LSGPFDPQRGFSLLEIIITLVLIGILGVLLTTLSGSSLTQSAQPLLWTQDRLEVRSEIENLVALYARRVNQADDQDYLEDFRDEIGTRPGIHWQYIVFVNGNEVAAASGTTTDTLKVSVTRGEMGASLLFTRLKKGGDELVIRY
jgi:prepilin-type N-terminal cleavage/methylation domain-containing protein